MTKSIKRSRRRRRANVFMLRARLVDRQGVLLRVADVESIVFIAVWFDETHSRLRPLGHRALDPREVVLDGLQNDGDWDVDTCGYNFCHRIDFDELDLTAMPTNAEFRYTIRDTAGEVSVVRFQVGRVAHD